MCKEMDHPVDNPVDDADLKMPTDHLKFCERIYIRIPPSISGGKYFGKGLITSAILTDAMKAELVQHLYECALSWCIKKDSEIRALMRKSGGGEDG